MYEPIYIGYSTGLEMAQHIHRPSISPGRVFRIAQEALNNHTNLRKVVIMKRIPRYDNHIRSELTKYGNYAYDKLWRENGCPANIVIPWGHGPYCDIQIRI